MMVVGYTCPFVPPEWLAAHGVSPRRIVPDALAGPAAGARMGLCPYARALEACLAEQGDLDGVVVTTVCDQMRRLAESISRAGGPDVFLMNVPTTWQTPAAARLYADELLRLGRHLVRRGAEAPGAEKLAGVMLEYDAARAAVRAAREALSPRAYAEALGDAAPGRGPAPDSGPPRTQSSRGPSPGVALVGGPRRRCDAEIFDLVERFGGRVVLDATEGGEMTAPAPFDPRRTRDDPAGELADAYFGAIPHAFRRPNSMLYDFLKRQLPRRGAAGIIFCRFVWCDTWAGELGRLREWTRLPVLDLEIGDDKLPAGVTSRIEAFLEML